RALEIHQQAVQLPLHDLPEEVVRTYLAARFPGSNFPAALAPAIHAHTGGQPLFLVAIVTHMLSRGWILETAPGWALSTTLEKIDLGVPDDVRRTIETQLHQLSPAERSVLEAASVVGIEITPRVVAAALDSEVAVAESHCEMLTRTTHFLQLTGKVVSPDGS